MACISFAIDHSPLTDSDIYMTAKPNKALGNVTFAL